jgi:hypothetical protein
MVPQDSLLVGQLVSLLVEPTINLTIYPTFVIKKRHHPLSGRWRMVAFAVPPNFQLKDDGDQPADFSPH